MGDEYPAADGTDPDVVFVVADDGIDFVTRNAVKRLGGFVIDETFGMVVFQNTQSTTGTDPQRACIDIFTDIVNNIVGKAEAVVGIVAESLPRNLLRIARIL
ncbi:MAG: hypothetical protein BWZ06_01023 [Bacteroidetes bacterium ADurb.BinA261]|nr:MAG: hypothetical protein BWZ06_01023 [Bacteroidetes bacterium ADurb.BinA261]